MSLGHKWRDPLTQENAVFAILTLVDLAEM